VWVLLIWLSFAAWWALVTGAIASYLLLLNIFS
jgi:hypothetical protein